MYDLTFLEYPYHEAVKFEQLTGELFVEGLSGALNIDRNSFNETDDYYLGLVKWFHEKLHDEVFPKIQRLMELKREDVSELFSNLVSKYFKNSNVDYKIKFESIGKKEKLFKKEDKVLYINSSHSLGKLSKSAIDKLLLASILVISNIVTPEKMEEIFGAIEKIK